MKHPVFDGHRPLQGRRGVNGVTSTWTRNPRARPEGSERNRGSSMQHLLIGMLVGLSPSCGAPEPPEIGVALNGEGIEGALLAAREIRASVDFGGLEVFPDSSGVPPQGAMAVAESLATNARIVAVIGHSGSANSLAASQVYNEYGLVHIAPMTTATLFSDAGPYSFRLVPGDHLQAEFLAQHAARRGPSVAAAVLYVNDDYGRGLHGSLRERLMHLGISIVYDAPFLENADTAHFAGLADGVSDAHANLLLWIGRSAELGIALPLLRQRQPRLLVVGSDGLGMHMSNSNQGLYTGVRFVRFVDPLAQDARMGEVRRQFRDAAGYELTAFGLLAHDAVGVIGEALRTGARTRDGVRDYLMSLGRSRPPYEGVAGPIQFDENGDAVRAYQLAEVTSAGVRAVQHVRPHDDENPGAEPRGNGHEVW